MRTEASWVGTWTTGLDHHSVCVCCFATVWVVVVGLCRSEVGVTILRVALIDPVVDLTLTFRAAEREDTFIFDFLSEEGSIKFIVTVEA